MKRRILRTAVRVAVVLALAAVGTVAVVTPASAARADCQFGQVCTWLNTGYNGAMYYYTSPGPNVCVNIGPGWNDQIRLIYNRASVPTYWYADSNCTGTFAAPCCHPIWVGAGATQSWVIPQGFSSFRWNRE